MIVMTTNSSTRVKPVRVRLPTGNSWPSVFMAASRRWEENRKKTARIRSGALSAFLSTTGPPSR